MRKFQAELLSSWRIDETRPSLVSLYEKPWLQYIVSWRWPGGSECSILTHNPEAKVHNMLNLGVRSVKYQLLGSQIGIPSGWELAAASFMAEYWDTIAEVGPDFRELAE